MAQYPNSKQFSHYSAIYGGLSRIDIGLGTEALLLLPLLASSNYEGRHISDHSPFWVETFWGLHSQIFCTFYVDLYSSKVQPSSSEIDDFIDSCSLSYLSTSDAKLLNAPLTEEELSLALQQSHNVKSPGAGRPPTQGLQEVC